MELIQTLRSHHRLDPKSAHQVLRTIEQLGSHSISPFELKSLIGLLQDEGGMEKSTFPYRSHVIHVISSIAKGSGFSVCRNYFDIPIDGRGITVPNLRTWSGPANGRFSPIFLDYRTVHNCENALGRSTVKRSIF